MHGFLEWVTDKGYAYSQQLQVHLESGSLSALTVVFWAGVLTSLTPCVYPMIPVTVTYIGGAAAGRRRRAITLSSVYVLGMTLVYSALGVVTALLGKTFGRFTYNPWVYGAVGALIVLFGVFMLDILTIPVPRFFSGVQTAGARKGGHGGALLMGTAAGFVAAPCTAPVLGLLLVYVARTRDVLWGGTLLFVFAIGLSTLLLVVGIGSGLLANLPRSGPWMKWIKVAFGVGMLLVGGWFLVRAGTMLIQGGAS
jgi:thiol:disulfide interchange protein DsbD